MDMIRVMFITMYVILSLPLIVLLSIGMFAWCCARAIIDWIADF